MTSTTDGSNNDYTKLILEFIQSSSLERQVLLLADDEMAFVREKKSRRSSRQSRNHDKKTSQDDDDDDEHDEKDLMVNNKNNENVHCLFAIVADGLDELIFHHWQTSIESYIHRGNSSEKNETKHSNILLMEHHPTTNQSIEIQVCELKTFITNLIKGNVRAVELLEGLDYNVVSQLSSCCPSGATKKCYEILYQSPMWVELHNKIGGAGALYGFEYVRSCCGVLRTIFRCKTEDEKKVEEFAKLLLHRASMRNKDVRMRRHSGKKMEDLPCFIGGGRREFESIVKENCNEITGHINELMKKNYDLERRNLRSLTDEQYNFIFQWYDSIRSESHTAWLQEHNSPLPLNCNETKQPDDVERLIQRLEMPLESSDILMLVRSGSFLYNLSTGTSDEDYTAVYITSMPLLLSHSPPPEFHCASVVSPLGFAADKRDEVEYDAKEIGKFVAECCKGNPRNIELLFFDSEQAVYMSPEFKMLRSIRSLFLTGRCCSQYRGFVTERLSMVEKYLDGEDDDDGGGGEDSRRLSDSSEAAIAKLFYHAFHKLYDLQRIVQYQDPAVHLETGSHEREFIMKIRTTRPLTGDFSPSILLAEANDMLTATRKTQKIIDQKRMQDGLYVHPREVNIEKVRAVIENIRLMNMMKMPPPSLLPRSKSVQRDRSETSSKGEDDVPNNALINQCLAEIEDTHNIRIIFAAECGSRVIGTSHQNSDHDIAALFVYQTDRYLSMKPLTKSFRADFPAQSDDRPDIEVVLWESRHAFALLANNNLTLLEAFESPLVYRVFGMNEVSSNVETLTHNWDRQVLHLTGSVFDRKRLARSALNQGESNYHRFIKSKCDGDVRQKKYIHVIRRVLFVEWLLDESNAGLWPPPLSLSELLRSLRKYDDCGQSKSEYPAGSILPGIQKEIAEMILPNNLPLLQHLGGHRRSLDTWLMTRMSFLKTKMRQIPCCKETEAAIPSQWDEILVPLLKAASDF